MKRKSSRQLYLKLLILYTAVVFCVVLVLIFCFINSTKNRYLEKNKNYMEMMHNDAANYLNDCSDIAGHIHEELYNSSTELNDIIHYLKDTPEEYQKYRLDTSIQYESLEYRGIEDFSLTAFEAYSSLTRLSYVSYSKEDFTYFDGSQSMYHEKEAQEVLKNIKNNDLAREGELSFLKEIRNPITMESIGAMIVTFDCNRFQKIYEKYDIPEMAVYGNAEQEIYKSDSDENIEPVIFLQKDRAYQRTYKGFVMNSVINEYNVITYMDKKSATAIPRTVTADCQPKRPPVPYSAASL